MIRSARTIQLQRQTPLLVAGVMAAPLLAGCGGAKPESASQAPMDDTRSVDDCASAGGGSGTAEGRHVNEKKVVLLDMDFLLQAVKGVVQQHTGGTQQGNGGIDMAILPIKEAAVLVALNRLVKIPWAILPTSSANATTNDRA